MASGNTSDTVPCHYSFTGGKRSIQGNGLTIIIFKKGGCAGIDVTEEKSDMYNPATEDEFMRMFSGDQNPYGNDDGR